VFPSPCPKIKVFLLSRRHTACLFFPVKFSPCPPGPAASFSSVCFSFLLRSLQVLFLPCFSRRQQLGLRPFSLVFSLLLRFTSFLVVVVTTVPCSCGSQVYSTAPFWPPSFRRSSHRLHPVSALGLFFFVFRLGLPCSSSSSSSSSWSSCLLRVRPRFARLRQLLRVSVSCVNRVVVVVVIFMSPFRDLFQLFALLVVVASCRLGVVFTRRVFPVLVYVVVFPGVFVPCSGSSVRSPSGAFPSIFCCSGPS
jgi:hypothetical protein